MTAIYKMFKSSFSIAKPCEWSEIQIIIHEIIMYFNFITVTIEIRSQLHVEIKHIYSDETPHIGDNILIIKMDCESIMLFLAMKNLG
jgi:hypothetical protein